MPNVALLIYAVAPKPELIRPAVPDATLTFIGVNATVEPVTIASITVTIPAGDGATDLMTEAAAAKIKPNVVTEGWSIAADREAGAFTVTAAPGTTLASMSSIVFTLKDITVNDTSGTAKIAIAEHSAQGKAAASVDIAKQAAAAQLTYAPSPSSLMQSETGASLVITATNATKGPIKLEYFKITVPIGDQASDLASSSSTISGSTITPRCDVTPDGPGVFIVTQRGGSMAPSSNIVVELGNIAVNADLGTAYVGITELAGGTFGGANVPVGKLPQPFAIDRFTTQKKVISPGTSTIFEWATSGASSCSISDENGVLWPNLMPNSDAPGQPTLTIGPLDTMNYTLTAYGPGEPVTSQTTLTVTVPKIISFTTSRSSVGLGDTLTLDWEVQYASGGVTLDIIPAAGPIDGEGFSTLNCTLVGPTGEMGVQKMRSTVSPPPTVPTQYILSALSTVANVKTRSWLASLDSPLQGGWMPMASLLGNLVAYPYQSPVLFVFDNALWLAGGIQYASFTTEYIVKRTTDGRSWTDIDWPALPSFKSQTGVVVWNDTLWRFTPWAQSTYYTSLSSSADGLTWAFVANANPIDQGYAFGAPQSVYVGIPENASGTVPVAGNLCAIGGQQVPFGADQPSFYPQYWSLNPTTPANEYGFVFNTLPLSGPNPLFSAVGSATFWNGTAVAFWSQVGFVTSSDGVTWTAMSGPGAPWNGSTTGVALQAAGDALWLLGGSSNPQPLSDISDYYGGTQTGPLIFSQQSLDGAWTLLQTPQLPGALVGDWLVTTIYQDRLWVAGLPLESPGPISVYLYNALLPGEAVTVTSVPVG